jgi:hypothetical protein
MKTRLSSFMIFLFMHCAHVKESLKWQSFSLLISLIIFSQFFLHFCRFLKVKTFLYYSKELFETVLHFSQWICINRISSVGQ